MHTYSNPVSCKDKQTYESKNIMQWACANDYKGLYRQEIDMANIKKLAML